MQQHGHNPAEESATGGRKPRRQRKALLFAVFSLVLAGALHWAVSAFSTLQELPTETVEKVVVRRKVAPVPDYAQNTYFISKPRWTNANMPAVA